MPRNVRNFWIDLDVDGRENRIKTGPCASDGGFDIVISTRINGAIHTVFVICGTVSPTDPSQLKFVVQHTDPNTNKSTTGTTTYPR